MGGGKKGRTLDTTTTRTTQSKGLEDIRAQEMKDYLMTRRDAIGSTAPTRTQISDAVTTNLSTGGFDPNDVSDIRESLADPTLGSPHGWGREEYAQFTDPSKSFGWGRENYVDIDKRSGEGWNTEQYDELAKRGGWGTEEYRKLLEKGPYNIQDYRDFIDKPKLLGTGEADEWGREGYRNLSLTGGFSSDERQEFLRSAGRPITALAARSKDEIIRDMARGGGYNAASGLSRLQRLAGNQLAEARTDSQVRLADLIRQGKVVGLGGLESTRSKIGEEQLTQDDQKILAMKGLTSARTAEDEAQLAAIGGIQKGRQLSGSELLTGLDQQRLARTSAGQERISAAKGLADTRRDIGQEALTAIKGLETSRGSIGKEKLDTINTKLKVATSTAEGRRATVTQLQNLLNSTITELSEIDKADILNRATQGNLTATDLDTLLEIAGQQKTTPGQISEILGVIGQAAAMAGGGIAGGVGGVGGALKGVGGV